MGKYRFLSMLMCCALLFSTGCAGESSKEFYQEGVKTYEQGNIGGSVVLFKSALEQDPTYFEARRELGIAYLYSGKLAQAETELQKAHRQQPGDGKVLIELARLYNVKGQDTEALAALDSLAKLGLEDAESDELRGFTLAQAGQFEEATVMLKRSLEREPDRVSARQRLGEVYFSRKMYQQTREQLEALLATDPAAYDALRLFIRLETATGDEAAQLASYRRLLSHHKQDQYGRYMEAVALLRKGESDFVNARLANMEKQKAGDYYTQMLRGVVDYNEKKFSSSILAFQKAITQKPTIEAYFKLGLAMFQSGNLESALSQFQVVVDRVPEDKAARQMIGTILFNQRRMEEAQQVAARVIELDPENSWAHNMLGNTLIAQGKLDEAEKAFDKVIAQQPGMVMAHLQKSNINQIKGKPEEVLKSLQLAVKGAPHNVQARNVLARFYAVRRKYDEARNVLEAGLTGKKPDAALYTFMGRIELARNNRDVALQDFMKSREASPLFEPAYFELAQLYAAAGEPSKALAELDTLLTMNPDSANGLVVSAAMLDALGRTAEADERMNKALGISFQPGVIQAATKRFIKFERQDEALALLAKAQESGVSTLILKDIEASLLAQSNRLDEALAVYDKERLRNRGFALAGKYNLLASRGQFEKALAVTGEMEETATSVAEEIAAAKARARALYKLDKADEALRGLGEAYERNPSPLLLLEQGLLATQVGKLDKAHAYLDVCQKKYPDFLPAKIAKADLLLNENKEAEAMEQYEAIMQAGKASVSVLNNLAMLYARSGKNGERALHMAYAAYMRAPESGDVLDTFGVVLMMNKRVDEAARVLERAVALKPDNASVRFHFAKVLRAKGELDKARQEVNTALNMGDFPEIKEAKALKSELQ